MSPLIQASCQLQFLSKIFFFLVTSTGFALTWAQLTRPIQAIVTESEKSSENVRYPPDRDVTYRDVYKTTEKRTLKYMLLWPNNDSAPFSWFGEGQSGFRNRSCSVTKCYVTANRSYFGDDLTMFDAIAFNGLSMQADDLPETRSQHQLYIYFNMESADYYPVCDPKFDHYFNWTATYRLNSDIPYPHILIRDLDGKIVGPKQDMKWAKMFRTNINRVGRRTKAAAWFVSNCHARNDREVYMQALQSALRSYGLAVDVYGDCGTFSCPRNNSDYCNWLLKRRYFFYMAMENSFDEDYVTGRLLPALQNEVLPIVFGGANYSRFLPPGSYIDATKTRPVDLAGMMRKLMHSAEEYSQYFTWRRVYRYYDPTPLENVCDVCKALHNDKMLKRTKIYEKFRHWWHPHYESRCGS